MMRAYDSQRGKMVVLTGKKAKIRGFYETDFMIVGGGLGGIAATLAICSSGRSAYLVEETDCIAGCYSGDGPFVFAENQLVSSAGASKTYREFRKKLMEKSFEKNLSSSEASAVEQTPSANKEFTKISVSGDAVRGVISDMLRDYIVNGQLTILNRHKVSRINTMSDRIASIKTIDLDAYAVDQVVAWGYIDASTGGDLFPVAGIGYAAGSESSSDTGEPHAAARADSLIAMRIAACADSGMNGENGPGHCYIMEVREGWPQAAPGTACFPIMREARRIRALTRITEQDISAQSNQGPRARFFMDSIGIGYAPIILENPDGTTITIETKPFQIPLGALLPKGCSNTLAGNANIGATRVAAGALRSPEIQWAVGEAAGFALAFYAGYKAPMQDLLNTPEHLKAFQSILVKQHGVPIYWYNDIAPGDSGFAEAQLEPFENPAYHENAKTLNWNK